MHQYQRNHKGQSFRHRTDNDYDGQRNRFHNIFDDLFHTNGEICRKSACRHYKICKIQKGNDCGAHITEYRNLACQLRQLHLQRRIYIVFLHLIRHPAHHGLQSDFPHIQDTFSIKDHCSAEQRMPVHKSIAGDLLRQHKAFIGSGLLALLRFSVQSRVVYPKAAVHQYAVRRNLVTRLQEYLIAHDHVIYVDHSHFAFPVYFTVILFCPVLQLPVFGIAGHAGLRRYKRYNQHSHDGAQRLIDFRITEEKHHDHKHCDSKQYPDHGITKSLLKFFPERRRFRIRNLIASVFFTGSFCLLGRQSI